MAHRRSLFAVLATCAAVAPTAAVGAPSTGGAAAPEEAQLLDAACSQRWQCRPGERLTVRGQGLDGVQRIEFLGGRGRSDDRTARPLSSGPNRLTLIVPQAARSGPVRAQTFAGPVAAARRLTILPPVRSEAKRGTTATGPSGGIFPIRGRHDMGQTATNGFGGGRGHKGQDLFAACGTPEVAVRDATVQFEGYEGNAGNYVVLQDDAGRSYAYMHMRDRALVRKGDKVLAGERVGFVGETGRAEGCHLHFELWTAPGWYTGGSPIDPLPQLKAWEADDRGHR